MASATSSSDVIDSILPTSSEQNVPADDASSPQQASTSTKDDDNICGICLEAAISPVMSSCCNKVMCTSDARRMYRCPYCRADPLVCVPPVEYESSAVADLEIYVSTSSFMCAFTGFFAMFFFAYTSFFIIFMTVASNALYMTVAS
ncbi:hypothetical protein DIPPA_62299 [Diplonema papillatum]|nr:hypothetical protein DIPPA_62299 [Diplonema papillatum]